MASVAAGRFNQLRTYRCVHHHGSQQEIVEQPPAAVEQAEESDAHGEGKRPDFVESALAHEGELLLVLSASRIATLVRSAFGDLRALEEESLDEKAVDIALEERSEAPRYLCATLDHVRLAVPIDRILEIVEGYEVTPLFNVPPSLRGLINLRGQVIACFDLSQDFSLPPRILEERSLFVILDGVGCELALCVDQILGIRPLEREGQQHTDSIWRGEFVRYIDRVLEEEEGTLLFLSVPDVFESLQLQADQRLEG